jgi:hypothetical protein
MNFTRTLNILFPKILIRILLLANIAGINININAIVSATLIVPKKSELMSYP